MAYIHKKKFNIISGFDKFANIKEEEWFHCDDLIAISVAILNKKGYRTTSSCSGHIFPELKTVFSNYKETLALVKDVKTITLANKKEREEVFCTHKAITEHVPMELCIKFNKKYHLDELGKEFNIEINKDKEEVSVLKYEYSSDPYSIEGLEEQIKVCKVLYEIVDKMDDCFEY